MGASIKRQAVAETGIAGLSTQATARGQPAPVVVRAPKAETAEQAGPVLTMA